jgi:hypothetical protein
MAMYREQILKLAVLTWHLLEAVQKHDTLIKASRQTTQDLYLKPPKHSSTDTPVRSIMDGYE